MKFRLSLAEWKEDLIEPIRPQAFHAIIAQYGMDQIIKMMVIYSNLTMIKTDRALNSAELEILAPIQAIIDGILPTIGDNDTKIAAINAATTHQLALDASNG